MIPDRLDFRWLKERVSIERFLEHRGLLDALRRRGHSLVGSCPIHHGDNPSAFVVNCRRNLWHCFTGCQTGGDLIELVRRLEHISYHQVAHVLLEIVEGGAHRASSAPSRPSDRRFKPFQKRLDLDPHHPFLRDKGIHAETAARFEVGAWCGPGMLQGCIAVRLRDRSGRPLGYAGRRLNPENRGKWVFPPRLPKSQLLYHYHRLTRHLQGPVIVVEGPWSVLRLEQLNLCSVALFGVSLSLHQAKLLASYQPLLVMLDGDAIGRQSQERMCGLLNARPVTLADGLDPDDLSDEELEEVVLSTLSF